MRAFSVWRIEDEQGEVVMHGGDYPSGRNTYIEEGCMPAGCYTLIMEDQMVMEGLCLLRNLGSCDTGSVAA